MGNSLLTTPMGRANKDLDQQETAIASFQGAVGRGQSSSSKGKIVDVKEVVLDNGRHALVGKHRLTRIEVINPHSLNAGDDGWMTFIQYRRLGKRGHTLGVEVDEKKKAPEGDSALTEAPKEEAPEEEETLEESRARGMADYNQTKPEDKVKSAYDLMPKKKAAPVDEGGTFLTSSEVVQTNSKGVRYIDLGSRAVTAGDIDGINAEADMEELASVLGVRRKNDTGNPLFAGMSDEDIRKKAREMLGGSQ